MEIIKLQLFKVDIEQDNVQIIDSSTYDDELIDYLKELFEIVIAGSSGRQFTFERETTEVRNEFTKILSDVEFNNFEESSSNIANRLFVIEHYAQEKIEKLGVVIQKGIIIQSLITEDGEHKFIICKADHNEFIDEVSYRLVRGLPVKKKAFKAFVCSINIDDKSVNNVLVYDTNPSDTKYWWKDFLELSMVYTDEYNTESAFNAIDKGIFTKMRNDHPQDYTYLRNSTVKYFRSNDMFEIQDFIEKVIGDYEPYDNTLNINELKLKIRELPSKSRKPFDNQFTIKKEKIKARFQNTIKLTNQIDLHIKENIPNIETVVFAVEDEDGTKYVKVKSEEGYRFFKKANNTEN